MKLGKKLVTLVVVFLMVFGGIPFTGAIAAGTEYTYINDNDDGGDIVGYYGSVHIPGLYHTTTGTMKTSTGVSFTVYWDDIGRGMYEGSEGTKYDRQSINGYVKAIINAGSYGYSHSQVVRAKQAAIWHYTNDFVLKDGLLASNDDGVKYLYNQYLSLGSAGGTASDTATATLTFRFDKVLAYNADNTAADIQFTVSSTADLSNPKFTVTSGSIAGTPAVNSGDNVIRINGVSTSGTFTLGVSGSQSIWHDAAFYNSVGNKHGDLDGTSFTDTTTISGSGSVSFGGFKIRKDFEGSAAASESFSVSISGGTLASSRSVPVHNSDGWLQVMGLPFGTYTLAENLTTAQQANYQKVSIDPTVTINNANGDNGNVRVTNRKIAKLTVHMSVSGGIGGSQTFPITVLGPSGYSKSFSLADGGSYPMDGLLLDNYTVTLGALPDGYAFVNINGNTNNAPYTIAVNDIGSYDVYIVARKMFGSIVVTKAITGGDAKTGDVFTFDLYRGGSATGDPVATQTIKSPDTTCTFSGLEFGDYTLKERNAFGYGTPGDFASGVPVTINSESPKGFTCTNAKLHGSIVVTKDVSGGDAKAGDIFTFDLYQGATATGDPIATQTIKTPATTCTFGGLEYGNYTLKERDVSGYTRPDDFTSGVTVLLDSAQKSITCTNTKLFGSIIVTKDVTGGSADSGDEFTFDLYRGSTATGDPIATQTIKAPGTTCTFGGLEFGDYTVKERSAFGYGRPDSFVDGLLVTVDSTTAKKVTCTNVKLHGSIVVTQEISCGSARDGEVFTFDLYRGSTATGDPIATKTIKAPATACSFGGLEYGTYTVKERVISGYTRPDDFAKGLSVFLNGSEKDITCTNIKIFGSITVNKAFAGVTEGTLKDGFISTFDLYAGDSATGDPIATQTCAVGTSSQVVFGKLEYGLTYTVKERAVDGYQADDSFRAGFAVTITDTAPTPSFTCTNTQLHGSATFTNVVNNAAGDGTMFTVEITGDNGYKGSVTIGGSVTDGLSDLPFGHYTMSETPDSAYRLVGFTPDSFDVGAATYLSAIPVTVTNHKLMGKIEVVKKDSEEPLKYLSGAEFEISTASGDDFESHVVATLVTADDGTAVSENLDEGVYYVRESKAPDGYVIDDKSIKTVSVLDDETYRLPDFSDTKDIGGILVRKTSTLDGSPVEGCTFELLDKDPASDGFGDSNIIATKTTDAMGEILFSGLPTGATYWVRETAAVTGYGADSDKAREVKIEFQTDVEAGFTDTPYGQVQINMAEAAGFMKTTPGAGIADAVYGVYSDPGCTVLKDTLPATDGSGLATSSRLPFAKDTIYYVKQITTPSGYMPDTDVHEVTFTKPGELKTLAIVSKRDIGSLVIKMVNRLNPSVVLAGAGFELYFDEAMTHLAAGEQITGGDGIVRFAGLEPGVYWLKQTKAPTDYTMLDSPVDLTVEPGVTDPDPVVLQNLYNPPQGYQTGMMDWNLLVIGGLLLIAGLLTLLLARKRKAAAKAS